MLKRLFILIGLFISLESSYGQVDPYFLVSEAVSKISESQDITEYNVDNRAQFVRRLLSRKYIPSNSNRGPESMRFVLPDGTKAIFGRGASISEYEKDANAISRENMFLYLEAPEGQNEVSFRIDDIPYDNGVGNNDIRDKFVKSIKSAENKNKLMVDLFNFANVSGESGRFFQELKYSEEKNKVYKFSGNIVLLYDLDYSDQDILERSFFKSFKKSTISNRATKDVAFRKAFALSLVREGLLDLFVRKPLDSNIKADEINSDGTFIHKIFEQNMENDIYRVKLDPDISTIYELCLSKRKKEAHFNDASGRDKAIVAFVYDAYSSDKDFFDRYPDVGTRVNSFIKGFADEILAKDLSNYLGVDDELSILKDKALTSILQKQEVLTAQEVDLLMGKEYFPSGLYYSLMGDLSDTDLYTKEHGSILAKLKLLGYKLIEAGHDHIELGKQSVDVQKAISSPRKGYVTQKQIPGDIDQMLSRDYIKELQGILGTSDTDVYQLMKTFFKKLAENDFIISDVKEIELLSDPNFFRYLNDEVVACLDGSQKDEFNLILFCTACVVSWNIDHSALFFAPISVFTELAKITAPFSNNVMFTGDIGKMIDDIVIKTSSNGLIKEMIKTYTGTVIKK